MNLYEIEQEIMNCVDMESGEVIDIARLDALTMERDAKIENIALWIKNLLSDAEQIKDEKNSLDERENACKNKADSLKEYLSSYLAGSKFSTPRVAISFRKSESVEVIDINQIMKLDDAENYLKYSEPTADKTAIKQAIKAGICIPGCQIVENQNIQIK